MKSLNLLLLHKLQLTFEAIEHPDVTANANQDDCQHGHDDNHSQSLFTFPWLRISI